MVFLVAFVGTTCKRTTPRPSENKCLEYFIEKDLEAQLKLSQYNIPVSVESVSDGSVKLRINATNERPLPDETILAIRSGQSLRNLQKFDKSVDILVKVEEAILKVSRIKSVSWSAAEPCPRGFVCATTGTSEGLEGSQLMDVQCAEFRE
jgi:hypothetical protein